MWQSNPSKLTEPLEGASITMAKRFGKQPAEFTFDSLFQDNEVSGWTWRTFAFDELFEGDFFLFLPEAWADVRQRKNAANVLEGAEIRQSLLVLDKLNWSKSLNEFLEDSNIIGFAYYPLYKPSYDQWVICTQEEASGVDWLYGIYSAGDWVFIIKADAKDQQMFELQLTSLLNSNPWYGWLENAKQREQSQI